MSPQKMQLWKCHNKANYKRILAAVCKILSGCNKIGMKLSHTWFTFTFKQWYDWLFIVAPMLLVWYMSNIWRYDWSLQFYTSTDIYIFLFFKHLSLSHSPTVIYVLTHPLIIWPKSTRHFFTKVPQKFLKLLTTGCFLTAKLWKQTNHLLKDQDVLMKFDFDLNWKIHPIGWTFAEWMENLEKFQNIVHFGMEWWYITSMLEFGGYHYMKEIRILLAL